jgi:beta-N-acetylhexosaminidase
MQSNTSELHEAVGQLLVGGFPGEQIHEEFAALVREARVGGAILFSRNFTTLEDVGDMIQRLTSLTAREPIWIAVDQEGGRVQRLRAPFPELPPMRAFGEANKKTLVQRAGDLLGASLRLFGIQQNYAPVLDVDSNPANPIIGDRSFSRDPSAVARLGAAFIDGIQGAGVAACGKHFPGHGDTGTDSHLELPALPYDRARLDAIELVPFRAAVRTDVAAIMTAHIMFPALDPEHPATLSDRVIEPLLRRELGYDGVIVSDDLEMKAIADHYGIEDAAVRAIRAGCDQLLICDHPSLVARAHRAIVNAVDKGTLDRARVLEAAARVRRMKAAFPRLRDRPKPSEVVAALPLEEHRDLLEALARGGRRDAEARALGGSTASSERIAEFELDEGDGVPLELDDD